ncbi:hypothetical protein PV04_09769 [Phialophora macrospora]|uniref:Uncharacterized protein n=1 Tax=Phialophora macrospora TaxID=1851006 RepID=A0A0D2DKE6_9EURO|nr:hypothetical protein PV04_09769 [Phialophora macrospora]
MAFIRLEEELVRKYNHLSVFAWTGKATASGFMPVLAASPLGFVGNSVGDRRDDEYIGLLGGRLSTPFSLTNQGVVFPDAKLR